MSKQRQQMCIISLCESITRNETFVCLKSQSNLCHLSWLGGRTMQKVCFSRRASKLQAAAALPVNSMHAGAEDWNHL